VPGRDLCFTPATALAALYRRRVVSPLEVTEAVLRRIDAVNPAVNAFVTLAREDALRQARRATADLGRRRPLPALFGIPVGIKDLTPTRGLRTTYGSTLHADHVPDEDALIVERLRRAGAIVLGKTNTPEFGFGPNTFNEVFGRTRNPWNLALTSGGSSGGSAAALATGMGPLATGSDLGGSLRGPAAFCGVVGFRTTPGLIPRHPTVLAWDSYSVEGPMARTVGDTALLLSVLAGLDDRAPLSYEVDTAAFVRAVRRPAVAGWRIAWTPDLGGLQPVDDEIAAAVVRAARVFRTLGARVERASPDMSPVPEIVALTRGVLMVARHAERVDKHRERLQPGLVANTDQGLALGPRDVARGELLRTELWHRVQAFLATRDVWLTPTAAVPPFAVEQPHAPGLPRSFLTYAFSVLGLPAISIPCGFTRAGLPVGLQIVAGRRREATVLRAAAAFEAARPWAHRVPPLVAERSVTRPAPRGSGGGPITRPTPCEDTMTTTIVRSQIIDVAGIEWQERRPGVRQKRLWEDAATARQAVLTRLEPGAQLPLHRHVGNELIYVIEGAVTDDFGTVTAGNVGYRPDGCVHTVSSVNGATVLAILTGTVEPATERGGGPPSRVVTLSELPWVDTRPGVRQKKIWEDPATERRAVLARFEPGATLPKHRHVGDELVFMIEGANADEAGELGTGNLNHRPNGCVHTVTTRNGATALAVVWGRTEPV